MSSLLAGFIDPRYRFNHGLDKSPPRFLLKEIYGDEHSSFLGVPEMILSQKHYCFREGCAPAWDLTCPYAKRGHKNTNSYRPLPNPFNKGDRWYEEVAHIIRSTIHDFDSIDTWKGFYSYVGRFIENQSGIRYEDMVDECMWNAYYSPGIQLMRFHGGAEELVEQDCHQGFRVTLEDLGHIPWFP